MAILKCIEKKAVGTPELMMMANKFWYLCVCVCVSVFVCVFACLRM